MASDVEQLLRLVPIDQYIGKFISLKRKGGNLWGLCPFHNEKTPSFSVSPDKGIFKCFGCGKGGNVITFAMEYERLAFPEALKLLAEYAGIELKQTSTYQKTTDEPRKQLRQQLTRLNAWVAQLYQSKLNASPAQVYLQKRGVNREAIAHFRLGYASDDFRFLENQVQRQFSSDAKKQELVLEQLTTLGLLGRSHDNGELFNRFRGRLLFPISDIRGDVIAFGGRILEPRENTGKYINSPESIVFQKKSNLYNLYEAKQEIRKSQGALLVEGYLDVIGLWQRGIYNAVAPLGTAFTQEQARLLKRYTDKVIVFFDNDSAGIEAAVKAVNIGRASQLDTRVLVNTTGDGKQDPFDMSLTKSTEELLLMLDSARDELSFMLWYYFSHRYNISILPEKIKAINEFYAHVESLNTELEKDEYLKAAAQALGTDLSILLKDFKHTKSQALPQRNKSSTETEKPQGLSRSEKDILALLLHYSSLWAEADMLHDFKWQSEYGFLLFSFFQDRFQSGDVWDWKNLYTVLSQLPPALQGELSGLILEYEEGFDFSASSPNPEKEAKKRLRSVLLTEQVRNLTQKQTKLLAALKAQEKINPQAAEEISDSLLLTQAEIAKLQSYLKGVT